MVKEVDDNGFWRIKDNPLSKEGVFPYLGKQIDPSLEPNKIYYVYRPISELSNPETVESFNAIPLIDEHEMIGDGFTRYDDRPAGGVIYNTKAKDGKLLGDIRIYSEKLKNEIESGKKELSMGYSCKYEPSHGYFDGKEYDFIQTDLRGNHVALVNRGRMGSDVRVYDQKITFDTLEGIGKMEAEDKEWNEADHPRDENGRFTEGEGSKNADSNFLDNFEKRKWKSGKEYEGATFKYNGAEIDARKDEGWIVGKIYAPEGKKIKGTPDTWTSFEVKEKDFDSYIKSLVTSKMFVAKDEEIPSRDGDPKESGVDCSLNQQGNDSMEKVDKRKDISEVEAMLYEAKKDPAKLTDELIKTIIQKMENNSYKASEKSEADDEAVKKPEEAEDKCSKDECSKAKDECEPKEESKDEAKEDADGEGLTEEKKDKEEGKDECGKKEAKDEAVVGMDALPKILESLEDIKTLLKGREKSEDNAVMYSLDETPVVSNKKDKGLLKYLGE